MRRHPPAANLLSVALTLLLAFPPTLAFAGPKQAREYFKQAKQAYTEGNFERAAALLEKAYAEEANLTYQYNRIRALEGAGQYDKALEVLKTYERPMLDAKGFEDVKDLKKSLQKKVEKEPAPKDDETADSLRETKDPPAKEDDTDETQTAADDTSSEDGGTADGSQTPTGSNSNDQTMKLVGWSLLGAGVASGLTATIFGTGLALPPPARDKVISGDAGALSPENAAKRDKHATVTLIFGGLAAATGIAGGVILLTQGSSEKETAANASTLQPRLTPYVAGDGGGAVIHLSF